MNEETFKEKYKLAQQFLSEKYRILPLISTIAVAALAVFSTNTDLIQDIGLFRVSLIITVLLISFSIFAHLVVIYFELSGLMKDKLIEVEGEANLASIIALKKGGREGHSGNRTYSNTYSKNHVHDYETRVRYRGEDVA